MRVSLIRMKMNRELIITLIEKDRVVEAHEVTDVFVNGDRLLGRDASSVRKQI